MMRLWPKGGVLWPFEGRVDMRRVSDRQFSKALPTGSGTFCER